MLRIKGLVLVAIGLMVIVGCSSGTTASPSAKAITIGFSVPAVDDYYGVVRDSFVADAKAAGINYREGNGNGAADTTQQIANIQTMLAQGIDVLAIAPPGDTFKPVLDSAVAKGVKVIFIDQQVPDWKGASTFIATNSPAGSQSMGDFLAPKLKAGDQVGIMIGIPGIPLLNDRMSNFQKTLEAAGIKVTLSSEADGCQVDTATNVARTFIVANPNLKAIYSLCGPTGIAGLERSQGTQQPRHEPNLGRGSPDNQSDLRRNGDRRGGTISGGARVERNQIRAADLRRPVCASLYRQRPRDCD